MAYLTKWVKFVMLKNYFLLKMQMSFKSVVSKHDCTSHSLSYRVSLKLCRFCVSSWAQKSVFFTNFTRDLQTILAFLKSYLLALWNPLCCMFVLYFIYFCSHIYFFFPFTFFGFILLFLFQSLGMYAWLINFQPLLIKWIFRL